MPTPFVHGAPPESSEDEEEEEPRISPPSRRRLSYIPGSTPPGAVGATAAGPSAQELESLTSPPVSQIVDVRGSESGSEDEFPDNFIPFQYIEEARQRFAPNVAPSFIMRDARRMYLKDYRAELDKAKEKLKTCPKTPAEKKVTKRRRHQMGDSKRFKPPESAFADRKSTGTRRTISFDTSDAANVGFLEDRTLSELEEEPWDRLEEVPLDEVEEVPLVGAVEEPQGEVEEELLDEAVEEPVMKTSPVFVLDAATYHVPVQVPLVDEVGYAIPKVVPRAPSALSPRTGQVREPQGSPHGRSPIPPHPQHPAPPPPGSPTLPGRSATPPRRSPTASAVRPQRIPPVPPPRVSSLGPARLHHIPPTEEPLDEVVEEPVMKAPPEFVLDAARYHVPVKLPLVDEAGYAIPEVVPRAPSALSPRTGQVREPQGSPHRRSPIPPHPRHPAPPPPRSPTLPGRSATPPRRSPTASAVRPQRIPPVPPPRVSSLGPARLHHIPPMEEPLDEVVEEPVMKAPAEFVMDEAGYHVPVKLPLVDEAGYAIPEVVPRAPSSLSPRTIHFGEPQGPPRVRFSIPQSPQHPAPPPLLSTFRPRSPIPPRPQYSPPPPPQSPTQPIRAPTTSEYQLIAPVRQPQGASIDPRRRHPIPRMTERSIDAPHYTTKTVFPKTPKKVKVLSLFRRWRKE